jgi:hypothetical protein
MSKNHMGFVGIDDPDVAIYRIFPLWFFEEALRLRRLMLVHPEMWEDPYELLFTRVIIESRTPPYKQTRLELAVSAYAQCWSMTQESDTLLRAYSRVVKDVHSGRNTCPRDEGVQVRSTPRKLLSALTSWSLCPASEYCFIGKVEYLSTDEIEQHLAYRVGRLGFHAFDDALARAEILLKKRRVFAHEAEVRLIYVECRDVAREKLVRVPIDPTEIFEEVSFDPRLVLFERKEREAVARALGYNGTIRDLGLYENTELIVLVD